MRNARLLALPLAAALTLAACSTSGPAAPAASGGSGLLRTLDLCSVLTADLAKQLIGDDAKQTPEERNKCEYDAESTGNSVTVTARPDPDPTQFEMGKKVGGEITKVDGVGEDAYVNSLAVLYARKGGVDLDVQIVNGPTDPAKNLEQQKKILNDVIARNSL